MVIYWDNLSSRFGVQIKKIDPFISPRKMSDLSQNRIYPIKYRTTLKIDWFVCITLQQNVAMSEMLALQNS